MALRLPRFRRSADALAPRVTLRDRLRSATAKILPFRRPVAETPQTDTGRRALMVGSLATAAVAPLPAFGVGDGGGVVPVTQELLDSYRAWLFFES